MAKFHIPDTPPSINKTIRFPFEIVEQVEENIRGTKCTFSAFVIEAVRTALKDLEEQKKSE